MSCRRVAHLAIVFLMLPACSPPDGSADAGGDTRVDAGKVDSDAQSMSDADGGDTRGGNDIEGIDCESADDPPAACGWARPDSETDEDCPSGMFAGADEFRGDGVCLPHPAERPQLSNWSCPDGWTATSAFADENGESAPPGDLDSHEICQPPSLPDECAEGSLAVPGQSDCVRQGPECPSGDANWPTENQIRDEVDRFDDEIVYVSAEADGGTGTRSNPYGDLASAVDTAAPGTIVAVGVGEYDTALQLDTPIALVGSCADQTIIRGPTGSSGDPGVVGVSGSGEVTVANLRLTGDRDGLTVRETTEKTVVRDVDIREVEGIGLEADGAADLEATRLAVRGATSGGSGTDGQGLRATSGSTLVVRESTFRNSAHTGVALSGAGTTLALEQTLVADTKAGDNRVGRGIEVQDSAELTADRLVVRGNRDTGIYLRGSDTAATVDDAVVAETRPNDGTKLNGEGLEVGDGAEFTGRRMVFRRNHATGVTTAGEATDVSLNQVLVADTQPWPQENPFEGTGLAATDGATLEAVETVVHDNHTHGVFASEGATMTLEDTVVSGTDLPGEEVQFSRGVKVESGARLESDRLLVHGNRQFGVRTVDDESSIVFDNTVVRDTKPMPEGGFGGTGVSVEEGASLTGRRLSLRDNLKVALAANRPGTDIDLTDTVVTGTEPLPEAGFGGTGIYVTGGADMVANRLHVHRNQQGGILIGGAEESEAEEPTTATITDGVVGDTRGAADEESGGHLGIGLQVANGELEGERLLLRRNQSYGLGGFGTSTIELRDAVVIETRPGRKDDKFGYGLMIGGTGDGLAFEADRLTVRDNHAVGLAAMRKATVTIRDGLFAGTRAQESDGEFGDGIYLLPAATDQSFEFERVLARDNHRAGAVISNRTGRFTDSLVTGNRLGLVREGETDIELTRTPVQGNADDDEQCRQQCYEEPPEPSAVAP